MRRGESVLIHVSNLLVAGTGVVYGVMAYLMEPATEWAVVNHPWQPHLQHLHVLVAPALVFAVGVVWSAHVRRQLASPDRRGRGSGLGMLAAFAPMVVSGAMIQVTADHGWRTAWTGVHVASSLLWMAAWVVHPVWVRLTGVVRGDHRGTGFELE